MSKTFAGKYAFQSTNPSGPKRYLTWSSNQQLAYPFVSGGELSQDEKNILYEDGSGDLLFQLNNLQFLNLIPSLGWVVATQDQSEAGAVRIVEDSAGTDEAEAGAGQAVKIQIQRDGQWQQTRYSVNVLLPYLVVPLPSGEIGVGDSDAPTYETFERIQTTPGLKEIQQSKKAADADFRNVDLSGADLSGVDCTGADFSRANLSGTKFTGATLVKAVFQGATLAETDFSGARLDYAQFQGSNVTQVIWGVGIQASHANFEGSVGSGAQIGSSDPSKKACFDHASFDGSDFSGADFTGASMQSVSMLRSNFNGSNFELVDFTGAQLGGKTQSAAASMAFCYMPNVNLTKANLFGVSFAFSSVYGANVRIDATTTFELADFSNAYIEGIDLTGAVLRGAKFDNACMINLTLTSAKLGPTLSGSVRASLVGARVHGAIFIGADLSSADLTKAVVAFEEGSYNTRHCGADGKPFPPAPYFEPLNHPKTEGLDLTTLQETTICPNGLTVAANQELGKGLKEMLTTADPPAQWVPVACRPSEVGDGSCS